MKLKKPKKEEIKILVVDDETIVALDIRNTLQKYGYKVVGIAGNSSEALKIVKSEKPNLILMDIMLKGQKDGIETSEEINKIADIPIIFLTAYSDDNTLERAKLVEPYGYLIKPFDNRELFTTIEMSLYKHSMEVSIRESEENLAITLNSIGDGVISTDEKGIVVRMNPVAQKLTGWKLDDARGKHLEEIFNIIDATTREPLVNPVDKVIKSGKVIGLSNHTILISKNGKEINISDSAAPIRDNDGEIRGVVLVFSDVTESYKARSEVQKSEEKFRALVTQMQQGLAVHEVITDKKGKVVDYRFLEVNDSYEKLTGLKRKRIIGKTVKEVLPDIEEYWIEKFGEVAVSGVPITYENYVKELDNYYEVVVYRNQPNQFAVIVNNITERKNTENKLKQNQEILTDIFESVKEGLTYASLKGKIISVNKALLDILELKKEEVIGADLKVIAKKILPVKSFVTVLPKIINILNGNDIEPFDLEYKNKVLEISAVYNSNSERIIGVFRDVTERKRAQERIGLMADLLDLSPASVIVHDMNGDIIYANKRTLEMHGYTEDQFLKLNLKEIDIPESAELIESRIKEINKKGELKFEVGHMKKDGTSFPLLVNTKKARWGEKDVLLSISTDISERKLAEEALRESEERFALAIDASEQGIWDWNLLTNQVYFSPQWKKMIGYEDFEIKNEFYEWTDHLHPEEKERCLKEVQSYIQNPGKHFIIEFRFRHKDGSYRWIHNKAASILDSGGKVIRMFGSHLDITERKLAEAAIKLSESKFNIAFHASPVAMAIQDDNDIFIDINQAFIKLTGYLKEEVIGRPGIELNLWIDQSQRDYVTSEFEKNKVIKNYEFQFRRKDGTTGFGILSSEMIDINGIEAALTTVIDITERKSAESALAESESKFRSLVTSLNDIVYTLDTQQRHTGVFGEWVTRSGLTPQFFIGRTARDIFGDEASSIHEKENLKVLNGESVVYEWSTASQNRKLFYQTSLAPLRDSSGNILGIVGVARDISNLKIAEEKIRESEEKFRSIIQGLNDSITIISSDGLIVYQSPAAIKLYGFTENEMIGKNPLDFIHPDDHELARFEISQVFSNSNDFVPTVYRILKKDGSFAYLETVGINMLNNNSVNGIVIVGRDVTERIKIDQELKKSELKYRTLVENLNEAVMLVDNEDRILFVNKKFEKLLGYTENEIIGKIGYEFLLDKKDKHKIIDAIQQRKERKSGQYEACFLSKNGEQITFLVNGSPVFDSNGNVIGSLGAMTDITERKKAAEELERTKIQLKETIMQSPLPMVLASAEDFKIKVINKATEDFLLIKADDYLEKSLMEIDVVWQEYTPEGNKVEAQELPLPRALQGIVTHSKEMRLERKDGSSVWQLASGAPIFDSQGKLIAGLLVMQDITEHKLIQTALKESEEKFRNLFNTMPNGYYRSTYDGYIVDANPAFIQMLGYDSLEELKSIYIPTDIYVQTSEREDILTSNPGFISNVETYRLKRKDGKIIWVEDNARYIKDDTGKVIFNEGICKDITDRKNAEDALRESEQLFNTLAQVSPVGIFRTDPDGLTTYVNPTWSRLSGLSFDEALGNGWINAVHPDDREKISHGWKTSTLENDVSVAEYRFLRPDGNILWVMGQAIPEFDSHNRIVGYVGTITDITDRKLSEDALRQSEEKFRAITEQTNSLISLTDANGIITYASPSALEIFDYLPEEMVGRPFMEFLYEEDIKKAVDAFREAVDMIRVTKNLILRMKRKDGSIFYGELNGSDFHSGESRGSLVVIQDISERIKSDDALRESEERFRIIAEKTGTIVYDRDLVTNNVHREGAIQEVLGYSKEEYNSLSVEQFNQLLHQEDRVKAVEEEAKLFDKGGNITQFYRLRHKNGNYVQIEDNAIVLADKNGRGIRLLGSMKDITERKHTEEALRESEELHRKLLLTVPDLIIRTNLKGDIIFVNESVLQTLGYVPKENLLGKNILTFISPKDKERAIKNTNLMMEYSLGIQEYTLVFEDGNAIIAEVNGDMIVDSESNPIGMVYVVRDITERKKAEENLRKLSHAVEQSQVSIVITNTDGVIDYVNPKFCEVTGYSFEEAIGQNPRILKSGEWKPETYKGLWNNITTGRNWTGIFHNRKKNGELFWESAHISPIKNEEGFVTHFIAVKEDITEKVKAEEELIRYREHLEEMVEERTAQVNSQNIFLRTLIDTIPNPIFVKDIYGNYTDVNPAFEKLTGKSKDELLGANLDTVLDGRARELAIDTDEKLIKGETISIYEVEVKNAKGVMIPFIVYKAAFGYSESKPEGIMGLLVDISERKQMEEKTILALNRERELNEMKTNFISMASHEFRTPLTTILASADLVELYHLKWPAEKILNHIKKIQDSVNYMTTLLDDVLTLSRADRGKLKFSPDNLNLRELCNEIIKEISYQAGPSHHLLYDCKLSKNNYVLDRKLLTQILNNLLSNAIKFSPEGGIVSLNILEKEEKIQFIVSDEGLGIDQNDLKNIFEPFFRGRNVADINGSGLGMNIVKNAIELHGGEIYIDSELNKGTKIIFTVKAV